MASRIALAALLLFSVALLALAPPPMPPGALVKVTITGEVGILLDEFPQDTLARAVNFALSRPEVYWREAAFKQLVLSRYRLIYRPYWHAWNADGPTAGQLPLPLDQFSYTFTSAATRKTLQGHDVVTRTYIAESFIVTDETSLAKTDSAFSGSGSGSVNEVFTFPVDPYLVLQRTSYDCMDEGGYPLESIDAENVDYTFDDSCVVEPPYDPSKPCSACHCTVAATLSCVDSLKVNVGAVTVRINFKKIPWDEELATKIEAMNLYQITDPNGADVTPNLEALQHNFVGYRFFTEDSCLKAECGGVPGWRRLLYFDASNVNVGGLNLELGRVDFGLRNASSFDPDVYHNLFYWDACHQHPHFAAYAAYQFGTRNPGRKQGFCIQTTGREINARWSPITTRSYTCNYQGVETGWSDAYQAGIPCQWVDVTTVDTKTKTVTQALTLTSNPNNWICEGVINLNADGSRQWVPTGNLTASGQSIDKFNCTEVPNAAANNARSVLVTLPTNGNGLLTAPCAPAGHNLGPKRDCEFTLRTQLDRCTPGSQVNLVCSVASSAASQVIRVCESSLALKSGLACRYNEQQTLTNVVLKPGVSTPVSFTCPTARDAVEIGGAYSTYTGPAFNGGDAFAAVTCRVA